MSQKQIVLVTGGTGFVGSHIVQQLLEQEQYTVRATARQSKKLLNIFPNAGSKLQVVEVPSLSADHSAAVKGVYAVIHVAAPVFTNVQSGKEIFEGTYHGALNVLKAAIDAGVKKFVITGTIANTYGPDLKEGFGTDPLTAKSWGPTQSEVDVDIENSTAPALYQAGKTLAEKKIWQIADENPDLDISVIIPPVILGPFVPNYPTPSNRANLGTLNWLYQLITGGPDGPNTYPDVPFGQLIDVRDVAKAHILSLAVPPTTDGTDKRFLICSKIFTWQEVAEFFKNERPGVANRLPAKDATPTRMVNAPVDTSITEQVLGLRQYFPWQQTFLDSIDELLRWEESVKARV